MGGMPGFAPYRPLTVAPRWMGQIQKIGRPGRLGRMELTSDR